MSNPFYIKCHLALALTGHPVRLRVQENATKTFIGNQPGLGENYISYCYGNIANGVYLSLFVSSLHRPIPQRYTLNNVMLWTKNFAI